MSTHYIAVMVGDEVYRDADLDHGEATPEYLVATYLDLLARPGTTVVPTIEINGVPQDEPSVRTLEKGFWWAVRDFAENARSMEDATILEASGSITRMHSALSTLKKAVGEVQ